MHPALSVIVFTVASGAGYGLLALAGLLAAAGALSPTTGLGLALFGVALGLVTAGLLSSTLHLGHPERAWRAVTQWRSSWLSREGVLALATYPLALLFALGWIVFGRVDGPWLWTGLGAALLALATIVATGMIYASLKPVPRWHNNWVVPNYLALGAMTGALWLNALALSLGAGGLATGLIALVLVALALALKLGYWRHIDRPETGSSAESATGLGTLGRVRLLEAPHTQANYLMREMGFEIARKHAERLRAIALIAGFAVPAALTALALFLPTAVAVVLAALAVATAMAGVLVERWLFFAEAKHAVTLYYGASAV
jgi:DMSO reductase anchor subunit